MSVPNVGQRRSRRRSIRFPLFALLVAAVAIPVAAWWHAFSTSGPAPDFTLTDQHSRPFTLSSERGHPVVLFFGYTHCSDTCPTALAHLAKAVRVPRVPRDVRIAFVTVDPARDTARVLDRYVPLFDPAIIGLTGEASALETVYDAYHVVRRTSSPATGATDYTVDHSTTIYYIGRSGRLNGFGGAGDSIETLARDIIAFQ